MKIFKFAVVMCAMAFSVPVFASGVIVDAKGKVSVAAPGGQNVSAKIGAELPDGTSVSVASGASASVMLMDGSIQEIGSGEKYTVGAAEKPAGKKTMIDGISLAMNEVAAGGAGPTVHGMVKMTKPGVNQPKPTLAGIGTMGPEAIYPVETAIESTPEITFLWSQRIPLNFANPVIVVDDASKKRITYKKIAPANNRIAIKASELKLAPGKAYSWYFASNQNGKMSGQSRRFNFSVLSEAAQKKLNEDKAKVQALSISEEGKKFLTAQLYYRFKMTADMVRELLPIWQKNQTDTIKKLLFFGYAKMGQPEEAKKYQ